MRYAAAAALVQLQATDRPAAGANMEQPPLVATIDALVDHTTLDGTKEPMTAMMVAAAQGRPEIVTELLRLGADIAAADARGRTAAHEAAAGDPTSACLRALHTARPCSGRSCADQPLQAAAKCGVRPIHAAAEAGFEHNIRYIAEVCGHSALEKCVKGGWAAAHFAAANGHTACLTVLAELQSAPTLPDKHGRTPAHLAASGGHAGCLRVLGADALGCRDSDGKTPMHGAAYHGRLQCLEIGLELRDAELFALQDNEGQTAAEYAVRRGHITAFQWIKAVTCGLPGSSSCNGDVPVAAVYDAAAASTTGVFVFVLPIGAISHGLHVSQNSLDKLY